MEAQRRDRAGGTVKYRVSRLDPARAGRFAEMTFPHFRPRLLEAGDDPAVIAFGAESAAGPIGLALAELGPGGANARLLSVFVAPAWRGLGVGTALLGRIERALSQRGSLEVFAAEERIEPLNSLGLRYRGEVVGWMVNHRIAPDAISYSRLFVRRDLPGAGQGAALLAASLRLHVGYASVLGLRTVLRGVFVVAVENLPVMRFSRRRLAPYMVSVSEVREARKPLGRRR